MALDSLHKLSRSLGVATAPAALLVDAEGMIRYKARAGRAAAALVEYAQRLAETGASP